MAKVWLLLLSLPTALCLPSTAFPQSVSSNFANLNSVRYANGFTGADIGAKANTAIAELCASGGVIEIPAGDYSYSTPIVLNCGNLWLRGHAGGTKLTFTGTAGTCAITLGDADPSTVTRLKVSDLALFGGSGGKGICVRPQVQVGTVLEYLRIDNFAKGIEWGGTSASSFDGLIHKVSMSLVGSEIGIDFIEGAHSVTVDSCWIWDFHSPSNTTIGIRLDGSANVRIVNSNIQGLPGGSIILLAVAAPTSSTVILGNYFEAYGTGIDIDIGSAVAGTLIEGNYSNAAGSTGGYQINLADGAGYTYIKNNSLFAADTAAIHNQLSSSTRKIFLEGNDTAGVTLIDAATGVAQITASDGSLGIGMIPSRSLDVAPSSTGYGARMNRMLDGTGNAQAWGWSVSNAGASNIAVLGETSSAYTTGGAFAWAGNSTTILHYPSELRMGTGTATPPALTLDANKTLIAGRSIVSALNDVSFSATPTFNASLGNTQKITLTSNVTSSTLSNATQGQGLDFLICQDSTGSWTFVWPSNVKGAMTIGSTLSTCSSQSFIFDGINAYATSAGVTNL